MIKGKQNVAELAFNDKDWTRKLENARIELRLDSHEPKPRYNMFGQYQRHATDLQQFLSDDPLYIYTL